MSFLGKFFCLLCFFIVFEISVICCNCHVAGLLASSKWLASGFLSTIYNSCKFWDFPFPFFQSLWISVENAILFVSYLLIIK